MAQRILVVEDTELLRRMYADRLVQDGYEVFTAANGLEAVAALRVNEPELILLDLVMPAMSGVEFLEIVKADPRTSHIPVLILSNLGQEDDIQRAMSLGAADYLVKNDSRPADVSAKIKLLLSARKQSVVEGPAFAMYVRDHEGDADKLVDFAKLPTRFYCTACQVELALELVPNPERPGWFEAHFVCPDCKREF